MGFNTPEDEGFYGFGERSVACILCIVNQSLIFDNEYRSYLHCLCFVYNFIYDAHLFG